MQERTAGCVRHPLINEGGRNRDSPGEHTGNSGVFYEVIINGAGVLQERRPSGAQTLGVLLKKADAPEVKPVPTQAGKTPAPLMGVLAGLGAAAADVSSAEGTGWSPSMQPFMDLSPKEMGVLSQMKNTPQISIRKLAGLQNLSVKEVRTLVLSLRKRGIIEHVGANNGGFWRIR